MIIRDFCADDWADVWPIVREVVRSADTFPYSPEMGPDAGRATWIVKPPGEDISSVPSVLCQWRACPRGSSNRRRGGGRRCRGGPPVCGPQLGAGPMLLSSAAVAIEHMFDYTGSMAVVLDAPVPEGAADASSAITGGPLPGFPSLDLRLVQLVVEQAAQHVDATADDSGLPETVLVERIGLVESLQHSLAALQAGLVRQFARMHVAARWEKGETDPAKLERSVAAQVGLACRVSPTAARKRIRTARDLRDGLTHVRALFAAGELATPKVDAVVRATRDLDHHERGEVDRRLGEHDLTKLGVKRLGNLARTLAAEVAPEKFRARARAARAERRVTLRPGEDGMTWLTAHLPVEQGVACLAALDRAHKDLSADPAPLIRSRGQVMADTLVERLTGQKTAPAVPVEIQALVPVEALIDPDSPLPAEIPGHGPIPVDLLTGSTGTSFLRRLITRAGIVIGGDSRRRCFDGVLADLIRARSRHRCAEPYCDAPVRHLDHIQRSADGGRTELDNGRGLCEFHNHVREQPGWQVRRTPDGVATTTPTGHTYLAPPG